MAIGQQIKDYQPTKTTLFWSVAGAAVLTMFVGFTWGGWVTGGTAAQMAEKAAEQSTAKLAAAVCVERFVNADDAVTQLAALKETSRWKQKSFVEDGKWTTLLGMEKPVKGAADLCAAQLADMELPAAATVDTIANTENSIQ
jgi:GH24 family phage-related lysozyme (muramidase)